MEKLGIRVNYLDDNAAEDLAKYLKPYITDNTVIFNIGTDKCIGDAVAPIIGTMLKENGFELPVYGTLSDPCHALNLDSKIKQVNLKHPNAFIIGIDACIGYEDCIGDIQVKHGAIHPGKGVGKNLPHVGKLAIVGVVDTIDNSDMFSISNIRLDFIMNISKVIAKALLIASNEIHKDKRELAVCNL